MEPLTQKEFATLLEFRTALRRFDRWSEAQARSVGLTHAQHQLLLAVKGHTDEEGRPDDRGPTITDLAEYLLLRHHSTVELIDRAEAAGYVRRKRDANDARVVRLHLTQRGEDAIQGLTALHADELRRLAPSLDHLVAGLKAPPDAGPRRN